MEQEKPVSGQLAQADLHVKEREGSLIIEGIQCKKKTWNLEVQNDYSFKHDMRNTASSSSRESVIILSCDI